MKKVLICLGIGTSLIGMQDPYIKSIPIPGALATSEFQSRSPGATSQLISSSTEALIELYAEQIKQEAKNHIYKAAANGKQPGTAALSHYLLDIHDQLKKEMKENKKNEKKESDEEKGQSKMHEIVLASEVCVMHVAATINLGIIFHGKSNP